MEEMSQDSIINIPFKVTATISTLKIDINHNFNARIIWKRHQNKVETPIVPHIDGYSSYNQTLDLNFMMKYDQRAGRYLDKMTKFQPAIVTQKGLRSGGEAKYNIATTLNKEITSSEDLHFETNQTLCLQKCPDETGYIQVLFTYQKLNDNQSIAQSVTCGNSFTIDQKPSSLIKPVSNLNSVNVSKTQSSFAHNKQDSFFIKKAENLERRLEKQQRQWNQQKQQLQMKILMMQQQMKQLKNRLVDKDQELKHTKAWNQSLLRSQQNNLSKIKCKQIVETQLKDIKAENKILVQRVSNLEQVIVDKASIIGDLLNTACDIGGRRLLNRLAVNMPI